MTRFLVLRDGSREQAMALATAFLTLGTYVAYSFWPEYKSRWNLVPIVLGTASLLTVTDVWSDESSFVTNLHTKYETALAATMLIKTQGASADVSIPTLALASFAGPYRQFASCAFFFARESKIISYLATKYFIFECPDYFPRNVYWACAVLSVYIQTRDHVKNLLLKFNGHRIPGAYHAPTA